MTLSTSLMRAMFRSVISNERDMALSKSPCIRFEDVTAMSMGDHCCCRPCSFSVSSAAIVSIRPRNWLSLRPSENGGCR